MHMVQCVEHNKEETDLTVMETTTEPSVPPSLVRGIWMGVKRSVPSLTTTSSCAKLMTPLFWQSTGTESRDSKTRQLPTTWWPAHKI